MKLYYSPGACSLAAHIAAKEEGLALDLERVDLATHRTEHKAEARDTIEKWLAYIADQLAGRDFLMGEHFSVADAYLFVILRWSEIAKIPLANFPALGAYRSKIAARPAVQAAIREEQLKR